VGLFYIPLTITPCMLCSRSNLNQVFYFRKLFQDVIHLQNVEKIMISNQENTMFGQKTNRSIPCKSRTPSGPLSPNNGPRFFRHKSCFRVRHLQVMDTFQVHHLQGMNTCFPFYANRHYFTGEG